MSWVNIKFDISKALWACEKIKSAMILQSSEYTRLCAIDFHQTLIESFYTSRFNLAPLNADYAEWKREHVGSEPIGVLMGDIIKNLVRRPIKGGHTVGVQDASSAPGKSWYRGHEQDVRPVQIYAQAFEYGRKSEGNYHGQPKRPVFANTRTYYRNTGNMKSHGKTVLKKLSVSWS